MQNYFYVGVAVWFTTGFFGYLFALRGYNAIKPGDFGAASIQGIFYGIFSYFLIRSVIKKSHKKIYPPSKFTDSDY